MPLYFANRIISGPKKCSKRQICTSPGFDALNRTTTIGFRIFWDPNFRLLILHKRQICTSSVLDALNRTAAIWILKILGSHLEPLRQICICPIRWIWRMSVTDLKGHRNSPHPIPISDQITCRVLLVSLHWTASVYLILIIFRFFLFQVLKSQQF